MSFIIIDPRFGDGSGGGSKEGSEIDDSKVATDSTWSSQKINTELSKKTEVDDTLESSDTKTYSINKIKEEIENASTTLDWSEFDI